MRNTSHHLFYHSHGFSDFSFGICLKSAVFLVNSISLYFKAVAAEIN